MEHRNTIGAIPLGDGRCRFRVWSPDAGRMALRLRSEKRAVEMAKGTDGCFEVTADAAPGDRYRFRIEGEKERPDPASRFQPEGVHGPSAVVDPGFDWTDRCWFGIPLADYVTYELHVGTFSRSGTFDGIIPHLDDLKSLGITAVELMPVAQFPGDRNWGYDGVYPFAAQESYGGPDGLRRLVDACHAKGLAVVLDVVYNHFGPEGNYLWDYGPYFTDHYRTPWGYALNFDGPESGGVRNYFIENALYWIETCHVDALRLDAVHAIYDASARPFLEELAGAVSDARRRLNRRIHLIAESDLNDTRLVRPRALGGFGLDAQWSDDFHHSLHALLTGDRSGYYVDFGRVGHLAKAMAEGYVYAGEYSGFRRRRHGNSSRNIPARRLVVCAQNHDQVGNRMAGDRLSRQISFEGLKLAAGALLLSPFPPLLFMGEEYGETADFPYFISHTDPDLVQAVREGRSREFSAFQWKGEPPDPQDPETFYRAKLDHGLKETGHHKVLHALHRRLLALGRDVPALARGSKRCLETQSFEAERLLILRRWEGADEALVTLHFGETPCTVEIDLPAGTWRREIDSADPEWEGPGGAVPGRIISDGRAAVECRPTAFTLWRHTTEPHDNAKEP